MDILHDFINSKINSKYFFLPVRTNGRSTVCHYYFFFNITNLNICFFMGADSISGLNVMSVSVIR